MHALADTYQPHNCAIILTSCSIACISYDRVIWQIEHFAFVVIQPITTYDMDSGNVNLISYVQCALFFQHTFTLCPSHKISVLRIWRGMANVLMIDICAHM